MKVDRALRLRDEAIAKFESLASRVVHYGLSFDEYLTEYKAIRDKLATLKTPRWVFYYLEGYALKTRKSWYDAALVWAHKSPDGVLYVAHVRGLPEPFNNSVDELYAAKRGAEIAAWNSGAHYWIEASIREHGFGRSAKPF